MNKKIIFMVTFALILSIEAVGSHHKIVQLTQQMDSRKHLVSFVLKSTCLWEGLLDHNPITCGLCLNARSGEITELYGKNSYCNNPLVITRKPSFEPTLFLSAVFFDSLKKTEPMKKNYTNPITYEEQQKIWTRYKNEVIENLNITLKAIEVIQKSYTNHHELNMTHEIPEFSAKNECTMLLYLDMESYDKNKHSRINIKIENGPITFDQKIVAPQGKSYVELYTPEYIPLHENNEHSKINIEIENGPIMFDQRIVTPKGESCVELYTPEYIPSHKPEYIPSHKNDVSLGEQKMIKESLPYFLAMLIETCSPANGSKILYKPNVKRIIIETLIKKINLLSRD